MTQGTQSAGDDTAMKYLIHLFAIFLIPLGIFFFFATLFILNDIVVTLVSSCVFGIFWIIDYILIRFGYAEPSTMLEMEQNSHAEWIRAQNRRRTASLRNWTSWQFTPYPSAAQNE